MQTVLCLCAPVMSLVTVLCILRVLCRYCCSADFCNAALKLMLFFLKVDSAFWHLKLLLDVEKMHFAAIQLLLCFQASASVVQC
jgi:hypothetical protein